MPKILVYLRALPNELLGRLQCILINYIIINNENSINLSADGLQASQIQIVRGFFSGPSDRQWDHVLLLISKPSQPVACIDSAQFLIQMLWKELANLNVLDAKKTSWFLSLGIPSIICVIEIDFIVPFNV